MLGTWSQLLAIGVYPCRIQVPDELSTECLIDVKSMCKNLELTVCHLNLINITYLYNIIFNIVMLVVALDKDNLLLYMFVKYDKAYT